MTVFDLFHVWRNPDQDQNARIYLKTILPYNKLCYLTVESSIERLPWIFPTYFWRYYPIQW